MHLQWLFVFGRICQDTHYLLQICYFTQNPILLYYASRTEESPLCSAPCLEKLTVYVPKGFPSHFCSDLAKRGGDLKPDPHPFYRDFLPPWFCSHREEALYLPCRLIFSSPSSLKWTPYSPYGERTIILIPPGYFPLLLYGFTCCVCYLPEAPKLFDEDL